MAGEKGGRGIGVPQELAGATKGDAYRQYRDGEIGQTRKPETQPVLAGHESQSGGEKQSSLLDRGSVYLVRWPRPSAQTI